MLYFVMLIWPVYIAEGRTAEELGFVFGSLLVGFLFGAVSGAILWLAVRLSPGLETFLKNLFKSDISAENSQN